MKVVGVMGPIAGTAIAGAIGRATGVELATLLALGVLMTSAALLVHVFFKVRHWVRNRASLQGTRRDRTVMAVGLLTIAVTGALVLVAAWIALVDTRAAPAATVVVVAAAVVYACVRWGSRPAERRAGFGPALKLSEVRHLNTVRRLLGSYVWGEAPENVALGSGALGLVAVCLFLGGVVDAEGMPPFEPLSRPVVEWELPDPDERASDEQASDEGREGDGRAGRDAGEGADEEDPANDEAGGDEAGEDESSSEGGATPTTEVEADEDGGWCGGSGQFGLRLQGAAQRAGIDIPDDAGRRAYAAGNDWPLQHDPCDPTIELTDDGRLLIWMPFKDTAEVTRLSALLELPDGAFVALDPPLVEGDDLDRVATFERLDPRIDLAVANIYLYGEGATDCGALQRTNPFTYSDVASAAWGLALQEAPSDAIPVLNTVAPAPDDPSVDVLTFVSVVAAPGTPDGVEYGDSFAVRYRPEDGSARLGERVMTSHDPCPIQANSLAATARSIVEAAGG